MRMIRWAVGAIVSVALLHGAPAWASNPVSFPLGSGWAGPIAVDDVNQHLFITAGSGIEVYDFNGNLVGTITGQDDPDAMVVHGSTLYVAEEAADTGAGRIDAIDLSTLEDEGPVATGLTDPMGPLVFAGGQLWTSQVNYNDQGELTSVSLTGDDVTTFPNVDPASMAASAADPDDLYVYDSSAGAVSNYNVSSGSLDLIASASEEDIGGLVVSPDGTRVILTGAYSGLPELSASTFASDGIVYPTSAPVATSSADGGIIATGSGSFGGTPPAVEIFPLGSDVPIYDLPDEVFGSLPDQIALSGDGTRVFAIADNNGSSYLLIWDLDPKATGTAVSVDSNPAVSGQDVTLTATVAPTDGSGSVAFDVNGEPISLCTAQPLTLTANQGTASCTTSSLPVGPDDQITATYSGDPDHSGSSGSANVRVNLPPGSDYDWVSAPSDYGYSPEQYWSYDNAWSQTVAPNASVGTLTFGDLSNSECTAGDCYLPDNNMPGLAVNALVVDSSTQYALEGDGITLGSGGLTVESPSSDGRPPTIDLPLTLGASQTWNINEGPTEFSAAVSGDQALTIDFSSGSIEPLSSFDVGDISATGDGGFYLNGNAAVNATGPNPISLQGGAGIEADQSNNTVGPVNVDSDGWLSVGGVDNGGGSLAVDGNLTFSNGSELDVAVDAPGTTAGTGYSQVTATGNIDLSGAQLDVSQGADQDGYCDELNPGDTLTLVSTSGTIDGTFANYANGASVDIENDCDDGTLDAEGTLSYSSNAVTLTITEPGDAGDPGSPPELVPPSLSGNAVVGQTLQINPGTWQGATSFQYSWWACDDTGSCNEISGAAGAAFQLTSNQIGDQIGAMVTAVGSAGTNYDYTNLSDVVAPPPVSAVSTAPTISGTPAVGDVLAATTGTWSNSPTGYSYQWERCSSADTSCAAISGEGAPVYSPTVADVGSTIRVQVVATNAGGDSPPAQSSFTAVVINATSAQSPKTSPAAVTAALQGVAKPTGKSATLPSVLSHRGYTFTFHAPGAGKLVVTWTSVVKHKTVTVAKGSAAASSAESVKVAVRLTAAGVKDLKRYSTLRIKSLSAFTATGLKQIVKSTAFTLSGSKSAHLDRPRTGASNPSGEPAARGVTLRLMKTLFGGARRVSRGRTQIPRSDFTRAR